MAEAKEHQGIAYFLVSSPPSIERYDMNSGIFLESIKLLEAPTAFYADDDGLYVSFGRRTSRFTLEGDNELHLKNTIQNVSSLITIGNFLYLYYDERGGNIVSVNKEYLTTTSMGELHFIHSAFNCG